MHIHKLREVSKFASGLVVADFICGLWLYASGLLPREFFGIMVTPTGAIWGMIFDVVFFIFLVRFGWKMGSGPTSKKEHAFHAAAGIIFALVAVLHLSRLVFGWQFVVGSWQVPYWLNGLGAVVAAFLSYASFAFAKNR